MLSHSPDMKVLVFYHYLYPDDVVSSIHFSDLCQGLAEHGWEVTGYCCTRSCRDARKTFPWTTAWNGVKIRRIWRPKFSQSNAIGRLLNSVWMIAIWSLLAFNPFLRASQLVIGTDPVMSVLVAIPWKIARPRIRVAHWCFDLYPDAAFADRLISEGGFVANALTRLLMAAYRCCDLVVDLGPCMKDRLTKYLGAQNHAITIPVWVIVEPKAPASVDAKERRSLFGDAKLAFIYSGNFGKAHSYAEVFDFARCFSAKEAEFVFSTRGNRTEELIQAISTGPSNVKVAEFATHEALAMRLATADVHIVTLRAEWTGAVVPSKFFGALATGRPVLFIGSSSSGIARWIEEFHVGWVINTDCASDVTYEVQIMRISQELKDLADAPERLWNLFSHCYSVYQANFSRKRILNQWCQALDNHSSSSSGSVA